MSGLRVNTLRGETAGSSPTFPDGVVITGVMTATSFSGSGASMYQLVELLHMKM